jgi:hypothetical protein
MRHEAHGVGAIDGSGVPTSGPGYGSRSPLAIAIWQTAAPAINVNSTMIVMNVNRRIGRG